MVATALQFKINSKMCSKCRAQMVFLLEVHLPQSWLTDPSLLGANQAMVATALQFKINSRMCNKFRPQEEGHLLPS